MSANAEDVMVGWTTAPDQAAACRLAEGLVANRLAACTQVSGPVTSFYRWDGKLEQAAEYRVAVKFSAAREPEVSAWIATHHPYETPQWVACRAGAISEKYLKWVLDTST